MNKKRLLLSFLAIPLLLSACNGNKNNPKDDPIPDLPENPDGYVDKLPNATKDGAILHCFGWSYNQIKQNLPAIADAGFKSVQVLPVQEPKSGGAFWWAYYQPLSFTIAEKTPLGSRSELEAMCVAADKVGVSVIVDVVANHLANIADSELEPDGTPKVSPDVAKYEPYIYEHRNDSGTSMTFHHNKNATGSGAITQYYQYGALPDLNTGNEYVQGRVLQYLKDCIDIGVDGFRFDAAKHIETPTDPQYASNFWPATLGQAREYYKQQNNGKELYAYGEILGDPGGGRKLSDYTTYMDVTDDHYIASYNAAFITGEAQKLVEATYGKGDASKVITWSESHDTYTTATTHPTSVRLKKMWAVLASRKDSRGLYFARPDENMSMGKVGDYMFENETIAAANRFHNRFIGAEENRFAEEAFYCIERYDANQAGAVIVDLHGKSGAFSTKQFTHLPDGVYYDQLTGNKATIYQGRCENFELGEQRIAILTKSKNALRPELTISERDRMFIGSLNIKVSVKNATSASYSINGGTKVSFTGEKTITIGDVVDANNKINLAVEVKNEQFTIQREFVYTKGELVPGYFNVFNINPSYFTDYEIYLWCWNDSTKQSEWNKNYTVQDGILLVSNEYISSLTGFLLGKFAKDYVITTPTKWDSNVISQSADITGAVLAQGYYDASTF